MDRKILIITGDGGEGYELLYAVHRFQEAGLVPVVAAPSKRLLNMVMHDFEPGWDTYVERPGYRIHRFMNCAPDSTYSPAAWCVNCAACAAGTEPRLPAVLRPGSHCNRRS